MSFTLSQLMPAFPELFMTVMIAVIMLADLFLSERLPKLTFLLTQLTLVACTILTLNLFHYQTIVTFHNSYILDHIAIILKTFIYATVFLSLLFSAPDRLYKNICDGNYYILTLFSVLGMMVLVSAYSFITLFIGLELLSLPLYAMIAMQRTSEISAEAALKYFVLGSAATAFLLFGMSMMYGMTDQLTIPGVLQAIPGLNPAALTVLVLGLIFIVAAIAFKLGAVPFHMWIPDVYEGAPLPVTLIISSSVKIAAFGLVVRLLIDALPQLIITWQHILMVIAILSISLGNIVAIIQTNIRRMLAYSSIAHIGYMSLGLISGTKIGFSGSMFYIIVYAIMSLGAFGVLMLINRNNINMQSVEDLRGLHSRNPWLAFLMLLVMFSMAGIPPSAGFFAKAIVLVSLIQVHLVWLAVYAIIFAIIGAYYYLRVVKVMYFDEPEEDSLIVVDGFGKHLGISVTGLMVLALGILPTGLFQVCLLAFVS